MENKKSQCVQTLPNADWRTSEREKNKSNSAHECKGRKNNNAHTRHQRIIASIYKIHRAYIQHNIRRYDTIRYIFRAIFPVRALRAQHSTVQHSTHTQLNQSEKCFTFLLLGFFVDFPFFRIQCVYHHHSRVQIIRHWRALSCMVC